MAATKGDRSNPVRVGGTLRLKGCKTGSVSLRIALKKGLNMISPPNGKKSRAMINTMYVVMRKLKNSISSAYRIIDHSYPTAA
jgi:hypothetical protein